MGQRQEGGKEGKKGDKMVKEGRKEGGREQEARNGGASEETGRGRGGSKLRQTNRAKLEDSNIRNTVKYPGHELYSIKEYLTRSFWHLPQDLFSFSDPGVPLQPASHCLSERGCELHLEVVLRPLSTLSSKGFYFLWQRMPLACCSQSLPWLTPHAPQMQEQPLSAPGG